MNTETKMRRRAHQAIASTYTALTAASAVIDPAIRRAAIPAGRDGYPTRASGAEPGTTTPPRTPIRLGVTPTGVAWHCDLCQTSEIITGPYHLTERTARANANAHLDETHGGRAISYSDPTGDAATTNNPPDPVAETVRNAITDIEHAARTIARAVDRLNTLNAAGQPDTADDPRWCHSCKRLTLPDGTHYLTLTGPRKGLCPWCYRYQTANGQLPTTELLEKRRRGDRIYDRDIAKATTPKKRKKARR